MGLSREEVVQLKEAGYTYHEIAQIAKVPTPVIAQIGLYGRKPDRDFVFDLEAAIKAKVQPKAELKAEVKEEVKEEEPAAKAVKKEATK